MKKICFKLIFVVILISVLIVSPTYANTNSEGVTKSITTNTNITGLESSAKTGDDQNFVDGAKLLTESEGRSLNTRLEALSDKYKVDVVIVTIDSLDGENVNTYAQDFFDYNAYGYGVNYDGILFLLAMDEREWAITTTGSGIQIFTDRGQEYITDDIIPFLSNGDYIMAFDKFADHAENFIIQDINGEPYDVGNMPEEKLDFLIAAAIALGSGLVLALIITGIMKAQLKSVSPQHGAENYTVDNSFKVTNSRDIFVGKSVVKTAIPKSTSGGGSSTSFGSSGRSHGGSSGRF